MTQTVSIFLSLSIALLAGLLLSRLAKLVKLPTVTAYLIAGVLLGPFVLGALNIPGIGIPPEHIENFDLIAYLALGFLFLDHFTKKFFALFSGFP